jgi:hypothetical protein
LLRGLPRQDLKQQDPREPVCRLLRLFSRTDRYLPTGQLEGLLGELQPQVLQQ